MTTHKLSNVFVQGAARGIGFALARQILAVHDVDRLFVSARDVHAAGIKHLRERGGSKVCPLIVDVTDEADIGNAMGRVSACTHRLDLVIVCAGVLHDAKGMHPEKRLADVDPGHLARAFAVNASGPLLMLKHCLPLIQRDTRSVFAAMSARVGSITDNGTGGWYAYRASKAALNQFIRTAGIELGRHSKYAICAGLHPGTVDTALSQPFQRNMAEGKLFTPEFAASRLLDVIDGLTPHDSGGVFAWDGKPVPA
jgi:NAD(P)-dependent dehydrogenase (short-subunit alcohol dehydrogenase family)